MDKDKSFNHKRVRHEVPVWGGGTNTQTRTPGGSGIGYQRVFWGGIGHVEKALYLLMKIQEVRRDYT